VRADQANGSDHNGQDDAKHYCVLGNVLASVISPTQEKSFEFHLNGSPSFEWKWRVAGRVAGLIGNAKWPESASPVDYFSAA
jgi:hypothetical protein